MEKGTVVDGTSCGVSGICVAGTCIVSLLASISVMLCCRCILSLWGVMGFLDQIRELIIVGDVMLLQESAYMFLVILIKNKMVYICL